MKAVWKGHIAFGLVNIPVKLYSAVEEQALGFRLLCGKCHTPIHYKRWCKKCKKEVTWNEVVKGIEIGKNKFFVLTKENIKKLKPEKTDQIEIVGFVDARQIDSIFFNKHYFVVPATSKEKAYFLFKEVLQMTAKAAIGRFVMKDKEHVCMIESYKNGLMLTTLNYAYEIRDLSKVEELRAAPKLSKEELKLAKELINRLYEKKFDIKEFKDTFAEKLKSIIKERLKEGKIVKAKKEKPSKQKEKTLIHALKASIK